MSMLSNVGNPQVYEDGDQRQHRMGPRAAGEDHDAKESRIIGTDKQQVDLDARDPHITMDKLASGRKAGTEVSGHTHAMAPLHAHTHEPSRGAKIDAEIEIEEKEFLKNKGKI
ncbi:hypothetical protein H0H93_013518 [Arthromyces matolae]|nr:hypothetical protein H0H93_013518 [Arthromyces matolae]